MNNQPQAGMQPADELQKAYADFRAGKLQQAYAAFLRLTGDPQTSVDAYRGMAAVNWKRGSSASAIEFLRHAVTLGPALVETHADLATMLMLSGQLEAAVPEWERVLELRPQDADVWHNYAKLLGDLRRMEASRVAFERALSLKPGRPATLIAYAKMLAACGDPDAAESLWHRIIGLQPEAMEGYQGLAQVQFERGQIEQTLATYERGVAAVPTAPELHLGKGQMLEDLGDQAGAEQSFAEALRLRPDWPLALEALLTLKRGKAEAALLEQAQSLLANTQLAPPDRANVGFGLGKALDAQGRYEEAFTAWSQANAARRAQVGAYEPSKVSRRIDRLIQAFTPELVAQLAEQGSTDERPVFVLGMPRSGTSLVEQIIAAHPDATGYGELVHISRIGAQLPKRIGSIQRWPEAVALLDASSLQAAAQDYLTVLQRRDAKPTLRAVDKAPLNFFYVGLIYLLFPRAKVIWCQRDARDTCLSIYGENFALDQGFATELADLGGYYKEYLRLMGHWSQIFPGRMYECVYEEMVAEPEAQAHRLIEAVGLPWDERCLKFHEQNRPVLTPSRWQVRQPMYGSSVGRWRNYEAWIEPLLQALGEGAAA